MWDKKRLNIEIIIEKSYSLIDFYSFKEQIPKNVFEEVFVNRVEQFWLQ